jgi:serine/threonine protein kinase
LCRELSDPKALDDVDLESIKLRRSAEGKYLVAVKTLRTDTGEYSAEELSKKFHQELSIISSLQKCPNIVKMLGFSEQPRAMVLKLYDSSLEGTIYRKEPPVLPIFSYATDILSALAEMHGSGIVHNGTFPR